jgi:cell division protein FtsI (penicillin-binding protein 3)
VSDIFISYTTANREWAFWIGQEVEKLGHIAHIHEWEISAGGDIAAWMEERHDKADHILCVISGGYLRREYSSWERRAAQWAAASARPNFALPVFVEECETPTLLAQIKRCNLFGVDENDARRRLTEFLVPATKPDREIRFPGAVEFTKSRPARPDSVDFPGGPWPDSNANRGSALQGFSEVGPTETAAGSPKSKQVAGVRPLSLPRRLVLPLAALVAVLATVAVGHAFDAGRQFRSVFRDVRRHLLMTHPQRRADIVDRNGMVIATSIDVPSLYADTRLVNDPKSTAAALAKLLPDGPDQGQIEKALSTKRQFVWVHRRLTRGQKSGVEALAIPGLNFRAEEGRSYPTGALMADITGYTDVDNRGIAGIEFAADKWLRVSHKPIQLAADARVQQALATELQRTIDSFKAGSAAGVVMDARDGEIIAMVSLPTLDPTTYDREDPAEPFIRTTSSRDPTTINRASDGVYEFGGLFGIVTTALALERGAKLQTTYPTGPFTIGDVRIQDESPISNPATLSDIFHASSKTGLAQIAGSIGTERQIKFLNQLGFLNRAPLEIPEAGLALAPTPWDRRATLTIGYGQGLSVTPVQIAAAVSALVNGGVWHTTTLFPRPLGENTPGVRVVSEETSKAIANLMRSAATDGSSRIADAPGYLVAGQSAASRKVIHGHYSTDRFNAFFAGAFPMPSLRYVIVLMIDDPYPMDAATYAACDTVRRLVPLIAPLLGVSPSTVSAQR